MMVPFGLFAVAIMFRDRGLEKFLLDHVWVRYFFGQLLCLSMSYVLPLSLLSFCSPSRVGTILAKCFNAIFFVMVFLFAFLGLRQIK